MKKINAFQFIILIFCIFLVSCSEQITDLPVIIQFDADCDYEPLIPGDVVKEIKMENFVLIGTDATKEEIIALKKEECVVRSFQPTELKDVIKDLQNDFDKDRDQRFKKMEIKRGLDKKDVTDKDDLQDLLEQKHPEKTWPGGVISPYQLYVTPDSETIQDYVTQFSGVQEIYDEALSWIWVSEEYLNGVEEMWYYSEEFLEETPNLETNPSPGDIASDCSEQANTLVSLLIADGWSEEDVRVVLGLVNFEGQIGGHAWVEIYEGGGWFALEATAGAYYDDGTDTLTEPVSIPYTYFKYANYPAKKIWYYYNNKYFWNAEIEKGNAPTSWRESGRSRLQDDLEDFQSRNKPPIKK